MAFPINRSNSVHRLGRDKLEQVCREQQKLMKSIKNESMTKIRDEEEKRKETQEHFQKSINDIFATLGKNNDENMKIKEANLDMAKKFKYLAEQYDIREKQLEKLNEQIKLEAQLNEAKLAKAQMEATIEKEILLKEKQAALEDALHAKRSMAEMDKREVLLKEQLHIYTHKYDEFQSSLQKSNDIFGTYKTELEKMAKRIKVLEKENYEWRLKYEKSNRALLDMVTDKQAQDAYVQKSARQLAQLQKLCRTLQAERTSLIDTLKANNIERPAMPELPPEPKDIAPPPQPTDKLDAMSRNCQELKATLAHLQGQMNAMSVDPPKPKAAESASSKKSKAKKNKNKNQGKNEPAEAAAVAEQKADEAEEPKVDAAEEPKVAADEPSSQGTENANEDQPRETPAEEAQEPQESPAESETSPAIVTNEPQPADEPAEVPSPANAEAPVPSS